MNGNVVEFTRRVMGSISADVNLLPDRFESKEVDFTGSGDTQKRITFPDGSYNRILIWIDNDITPGKHEVGDDQKIQVHYFHIFDWYYLTYRATGGVFTLHSSGLGKYPHPRHLRIRSTPCRPIP
jgi:hypothetical protein